MTHRQTFGAVSVFVGVAGMVGAGFAGWYLRDWEAREVIQDLQKARQEVHILQEAQREQEAALLRATKALSRSESQSSRILRERDELSARQAETEAELRETQTAARRLMGELNAELTRVDSRKQQWILRAERYVARVGSIIVARKLIDMNSGTAAFRSVFGSSPGESDPSTLKAEIAEARKRLDLLETQHAEDWVWLVQNATAVSFEERRYYFEKAEKIVQDDLAAGERRLRQIIGNSQP